jgi:hypothetical protein
MYHLFSALQSEHNQPKFERVSISDNHDEGDSEMLAREKMAMEWNAGR